MKGEWAGSGGLWILYDGEGREWAWWFIRFTWCALLLAPFAWAPWPPQVRSFGLLSATWGKVLGLGVMLLVWRLVRLAADHFLQAVQIQGWRRTKASGDYWYVAVFFLPFLFFFQMLGGWWRWRGWGLFEAFQICLLLAFMLLLELFAGLRRISEAREAAEDAAQRSRLEPHFLFNVLNDIQAQIPGDPAAAAAALGTVGQLMRSVLALADRPLVPLEEELAFVETYLGLQRLRLGPRLKVVVEVPEEAEPLLVPTLSLHTLVENAVKHGISRRPSGGELRLWARVEPRYDAFTTSSDLTVGVENDLGEADGAEPPMGTGTGLASLRMRLRNPGDLGVKVDGRRFQATLTWRQA